MSWKCVTCDQVFETIPEDAVLVAKPSFSRVTVYRFADGAIHSLRQGKSAQTIHRTWHKTSRKIGCEFCYPPPEPELPVEQVLLQEVVLALSELPEPPQEPEIEVEESEPTTAMAAAFRRFKS